ncbi:acyloxyacyl hydrolase [Mucilaginibacter sp. HMF5004]|uniref:acyloxyacyl hydrolase n=1 Tax=Mucilaginibacter rivuli TaxID=2857527 RepID=UPI001C5D43F9|nr:acyloxyacyl hydrolase [Mucilaginibacter rivuli]MBW4891931.1 acyloxyacyl hydrolase [Mucilaginibacter rivuli]
MSYKFTRAVLFIIAALFFENVLAQDKQNSIEFSPHYGIGMFSGEGNTINGNFYGAEAVYHLNMANNNADWVRMFHVKNISVAASYHKFDQAYLPKQSGSQGILGNVFGLITRLDISLFNIGQADVRFTPGFGFVYAAQTYYTNGNPLIGSHINFAAQAGVKLVTPVSATTRLLAGIDLFHYSNAAVKLPNNGVNSIQASIGIDHDIDKAGPGTSKSNDTYRTFAKHSFEISANIGRRGLFQTNTGLPPADIEYQKQATSKIYKSGLYAGYTYRLNPLIGLKLGADATYYYTTLDTVQDVHHFYATFQELGSSYDSWRVGISTGADINLGRVVFGANYVKYLHFNSYQGLKGFHPNPPNWSWNFGCKYFITPSFAIEAKQYLHRTEADYVGIGFLYRLKLSD